MADGTVTGCPSRHLVPKDQSMTLPMPAWESAEGCGGRPKGLTELPSQGPQFSMVG
jgi:hypothetical protein